MAQQRARKRKTPGERSLDRLHESIDAAQAALKDVRSEMSRGSRELLKDVESTLRDTRRNLRGVSRRVSKELGTVEQTVRGQKKPAQRKPAQRKPARSSSGARRTAKK
jgi:predicted metal-dependent hydrolase